MGTSVARSVDQVVNTARYPLSDPGTLIPGIRRELENSGCCVLPDFIQEPLVAALREECATAAPLAHYDVETVNVYNIAVDPSLPADHPGRVPFDRGNAFVARDHIPADFIVQRLYSSELFQRFVAACFGLNRVHELADPLSGLCLNVVKPGMQHPWHFDVNEFTVSMVTQEAAEGGEFEYCPNIRSAENENFADVASVLGGDDGGLVRRLTLRPGDLQLFKGRYSLHRVTTVKGATARHSAIFAYSERPGVIGSVARTRQLFGRVLPQHLEAEGHAVRVDRLLD
ncbi:arpA protein [Actinomadura barringtoniae]|uniref:ArpA protein n=1 Tax=Actinomadura barringtoniae TaxID=1427535 RepID=A0A939PK68_9ACTN|nr:arpA protein [Actinomadura barringtoniae]MBO2450679.1 arpA protein [Actinomadura barringtoniae]